MQKVLLLRRKDVYKRQSLDSVDVWAHPELFQLDENRNPREVAGCPPDGFSADGQLWGNPLFDWEYMEKNDYDWWVRRIQYLCKVYDILRIDHFRGFDSYYAIPYGNTTARGGRWKQGPGIALFLSLIHICSAGYWGLIILMCWQQIGYMMIIYIAGLQNVSDDLLEAAQIDGATPWQTLWKVKLPMVMPSITICVFLTLTNSFKLFDQNLALTGGDPNHMTEMLALNIYQTFYARAGAQWKGLGQAKAVLFCLLVIVISVLQLRATRKREVQQ